MATNHHTPERCSSKSTHGQTRSLKVRKGYYSRIIKDKNHNRFDQTVASTIPWINLQGQWLERAGFSIDTPITVRVMKGCLVLTTEPIGSDITS
ncbi:MAG: SymE family type I addiction module toxin [Sedimenticola sp.]